jgi:hypothetical protein
MGDPYYYVKDQKLHDAITRFANLRFEMKRKSASEIYNEPENRDAIAIVLAAAESMNLDELPLGMRNLLERCIHAAIISGSNDHLPALKKLAHSKFMVIREAVGDSPTWDERQSPSLEVLLECVLGSEEALPNSLDDMKSARPLLEEFRSSVCTYAMYANQEQRTAILKPIVDRFLNRYNNQNHSREFRDYYDSTLQKALQGQGLRVEVQ